MADALEFVFVKLSEAFVTHGTERPGIVLRRNEDGSADVLVFHHPEDRQGAAVETWLRVPEEGLRAADGRASASSPAEPDPPPLFEPPAAPPAAGGKSR